MLTVRLDISSTTTAELIEERNEALRLAKQRCQTVSTYYRMIGLKYHKIAPSYRDIFSTARCKELFVVPKDGSPPDFARELESITNRVDISQVELDSTHPQDTLDFLKAQRDKLRELSHDFVDVVTHVEKLARDWDFLGKARTAADISDFKRELSRWVRHTRDVSKAITLGFVQDTQDDILDFILAPQDVMLSPYWGTDSAGDKQDGCVAEEQYYDEAEVHGDSEDEDEAEDIAEVAESDMDVDMLIAEIHAEMRRYDRRAIRQKCCPRARHYTSSNQLQGHCVSLHISYPHV